MELTSCERAFIQPNGCVTAGLEPWQVSIWWEWKWFPPKEWGWIQSSPYKLDAHFTSKLHPGNRKNKLDSTQEDIFLHHLIIWAWNHNACQMKKWWCRMWKSVVFRENIHGPGRLSHKVVASPNFLCQSFELQRKHVSLAKSAIVAFNSKFMKCH